MYVLKAFADSHPLNRLCCLIEKMVRADTLRGQFLQQFVADFQRNPTVVVKPKYWESTLLTLKEYWHRDRFGIHSSKNMQWNLPAPHERELRFGFETIRRIYEDQFQRMQEECVTYVYHEGLGAHPLKSFATRLLGLGFYDLDRRPYRGHLTPDEQRTREQTDWVPHIRPTPAIESARIVAGRNHIYNRYGLATALQDFGIRLEISVDYGKIDSQLNI